MEIKKKWGGGRSLYVMHYESHLVPLTFPTQHCMEQKQTRTIQETVFSFTTKSLGIAHSCTAFCGDESGSASRKRCSPDVYMIKFSLVAIIV